MTGVNIAELYKKFLLCSGVSTDTRTIIKGQLFVSLKGPSFDGNKYAGLALERGAAFALVDDPALVDGPQYLLVADGLSAMQQLAAHHRNQLNIPVLGITGSNGKTTTKELLTEVLSTSYKVSATKGNLNNHIGVPLTILNAKKDAEILIVEMGTNQPGDIKMLCDIAKPNLGLITNIGASHLERLGSIEGVFKDKSELFYHVMSNENGHFFLNVGDKLLNQLKGKKAAIKSYTKTAGSFGRISESSNSNKAYLTYTYGFEDQERICDTHLYGAYNLENIAAALEVGSYFKINVEAMIVAIAGYIPSNMRSQLVSTDSNQVILDAYNANPSSMKACLLDVIARYSSKAIFPILGDMLELGVESQGAHEEIYQLLKMNKIEHAILVGTEFASINQYDYPSYRVVSDLIESNTLQRIKNKTVLIKGSRGIKLEQILTKL